MTQDEPQPTPADAESAAPPLRTGRIALAAAGVIVLVVAGANVMARSRLTAARQAAATAGIDLDGTLARHPAAPSNAAAKEAAKRAAALGIRLGTVDVHQPLVPEAERTLESVMNQVHVFVGAQQARVDDGREPIPEAIARYLAAHGAEIDALAAALAQGPAFARDIARGPQAPLPVLAGSRKANALLMARALEADAKGDGAAVEAALRGAWALATEHRTRPEYFPQSIAVAMDREVIAILRALRTASPAWGERAGKEMDHRAALRASLQTEAYFFSHIPDDDPSEWNLSGLAGVGPLRSIVLGFSAADQLERMARQVPELTKTDACSFDGRAWDESQRAMVPEWNALYAQFQPNFGTTWAAAGRAGLEADLTRRVLRLRADPKATGDLGAGEACSGVRWKAVAGEKGIAITPEPAPPGAETAPASGSPLVFTLLTPPAAATPPVKK